MAVQPDKPTRAQDVAAAILEGQRTTYAKLRSLLGLLELLVLMVGGGKA